MFAVLVVNMIGTSVGHVVIIRGWLSVIGKNSIGFGQIWIVFGSKGSCTNRCGISADKGRDHVVVEGVEPVRAVMAVKSGWGDGGGVAVNGQNSVCVEIVCDSFRSQVDQLVTSNFFETKIYSRKKY